MSRLMILCTCLMLSCSSSDYVKRQDLVEMNLRAERSQNEERIRSALNLFFGRWSENYPGFGLFIHEVRIHGYGPADENGSRTADATVVVRAFTPDVDPLAGELKVLRAAIQIGADSYTLGQITFERPPF